MVYSPAYCAVARLRGDDKSQHNVQEAKQRKAKRKSRRFIKSAAQKIGMNQGDLFEIGLNDTGDDRTGLAQCGMKILF
jgi:hypothetical protein